jgi:NAD(P)-dependent dehydrogenase (short-subunit alcohol dehydrogenase family)
LEHIQSKGFEYVTFDVVDVTNEDSVGAWVDKTAEKFGGIDILINNAAAFVFGKIEEVTSESWDKVLGVNVKVRISLSCIIH